MIESNTSKFKDTDKEVIIEKIAKAVKEITLANDRMTFIEQMISLSKLLMTHDLHISSAYKGIDEKAQDPTYFVAAYYDTNDIDQALWIHRMVRLLARYILLYDRFFELGENKYKVLARKVRRSINEHLANANDKDHLNYSIDFSLKQFWPFWNFEKIVKRRILEGHTFSYKEIRNFNQFKSSDASIVYAKVLDAKLPSFNENVSLVLHYNQALLDLLDDWQDIEEDVQEDMPNVFVMASLEVVPYSKIKNSNHLMVRNIIRDALDSSNVSVIGLVDEYQASVKNISIPDKFGFLRVISDYHANTLLGTIRKF
ncbi:MAG: hypothetical protein WBZ50_10795 [Nitrososphaeraceae archaeon]